MPVLKERLVWKRPERAKESRSRVDYALTKEESAHAKKALKMLRARYGDYGALAKALATKRSSLYHALDPGLRVSAGLALRIARCAEVPLEAILEGKWPHEGACPLCGRP